VDTKGNITSIPVPLTRDSNNHINSLDHNGKRYIFNLDTEGNVLSINLSDCVARFEYTPDNPRTGEQVILDASESYSSKGNIVSYEWDFGDGNITTTEEPATKHAYNLPGKYTIRLKVTDDYDLRD